MSVVPKAARNPDAVCVSNTLSSGTVVGTTRPRQENPMPWLRTLLVLLAFAPAARADDWPQWLGPRRDGTTTEKVAPWKEAPKAAWRFPVEKGYACPVIAQGRVFVHAAVKDKDAEEVIALDAEKGEMLWKNYDEPASTSSPVLFAGPPQPGRLPDVVFMTSLRLLAVNPLDGSLSWEFPLVFQSAGASTTPLVVGDQLLTC